MEPSYERVQKSLIVFNVILAVISLICLLFSFVFNCWTFKLSYKLDGEDVKILLKATMSDESRPYIDAVKWEDFGAQTVYLNVGVNTIDSLAAIFADDKTVVKRLLDRQVDSVIAQARPIANTMLKFLSRAFLEVTVRQIAAAEGSSDESIDLSGVESVIDNYLDNKLTKDDVINQILDISAIEIPKLSGEELSEADRQQVKDNFDALLGSVEKCRGEDGRLDMISIIYGKLVEAGVFTNIGDIPTGAEAVSVIKQKVYSRLESAGIVGYLSIAIKILALLVLVQAVSWLLLLLFSTIRVFSRRKSTGLMFVRTFAWIPHIILVGIPNALLILMGLINPLSLANIGLEKLSLSFSSITSVSAGGALVVSVIAIAFYNRLRRQERDYLEEEADGVEMIYPDMRNPIQPDGYQNGAIGAPVEFSSDNSARFDEPNAFEAQDESANDETTVR